jgi:hypothetical protein
MRGPGVLILAAASGGLGPALMATNSSAQPASGSQPGAGAASAIVVADTTIVVAEMVAIDRKGRMVTLRSEDGSETTLKVDPSIGNFEQIEAGDEITVECLAAMAVFIAKPEADSGAASVAADTQQYGTAVVAPRGDKPAGLMVPTVQLVATIDDIDAIKRAATLRDPQGNSRTVKIGDGIQNLDRFKKGDTVLIRYTEPVAIAISR